MQVSGTGVDKVPRSIYDGRDRHVRGGASAEPISEWVMAAVLAWAKRMPETILHEPPRHWNFPWPRLDAVAGSTIALVGLGGIGAAIARARARVRHARARAAPHRRAEPGRRRAGRARVSTSWWPTPIISCSRRRRRPRPAI